MKHEAVFADAGMAAIAANSERYVAVGVTGGNHYFRRSVQNADRGGVIWTSVDGVAWRRESVPDGAAVNLTGLITDRLGFIAWGATSEPRSSIWISSDGLAWERATDNAGLAGVAITGIARLGDRLVAMASQCTADDFDEDGNTCVAGASLALESLDGRTWRPISGWTGIDELTAGLAGSSAVLVAYSWSDLFRSTNGAQWTRVTPPARQGPVLSVAGYTGGFVALGQQCCRPEVEAGPPDVPARIWTSSDGRGWRTATFHPSTNGALHLAAVQGDELVALGRRPDGRVFCYRSSDHRTWVRMTTAPDAIREGGNACTGGICYPTEVTSLANGPQGVVAVGTTTLESGQYRAVVWTLR